MLGVSVKADVRAAVAKLGQVNRDVDRAAYRAINKGIASGSTIARRGIASDLKLRKQSLIKANIRRINANISNLTGFLVGWGAPITVDNVKGVRHLDDQNVVIVQSRGKTRRIDHAWKSKRSDKYYRKEPGQKPKGISVMSVPDMFIKLQQPIRDAMQDSFGKEFIRLINLYISK